MEPFGAKTTADEVARSAYVAGKTIIVTGGSAGMGLETVRVLANAGADVLMCCRDVDHGKKMKQILEVSSLHCGISHRAPNKTSFQINCSILREIQ